MSWTDDLRRDARLAVRRARRRPTFTAVVVTCLALGIGSATGVFSVLEPALLEPLPFEDASDLHVLAAFDVGRTDPDERYWMSWFPIRDLQRSSDALEGVAGFYQREFDLVGDGEAERVAGAETLPGSFAVLGVEPVLGREIDEEDMRLGRRVVLIGEAFWARRFARDPQVLGRTLTLKGHPYEIIGVIPGEVRHPNRAELWAGYVPDEYTRREHLTMGAFGTIGRLARSSDEADLRRDLDAMLARIQEAEPLAYGHFGFESLPLREALTGDFRTPLLALFGGALFVLVVAAANVANLLLARAQADTWERALRTALGAQGRTLVQQSLVENLALAAAGAGLGTLLALWGVRGLLAVAPLSSPAFDRVGLSYPVLALALLLSVAVATLLSLVPVAGRGDAPRILHEGRAGARREDRRLRTAFVVGQVALSLVLLVTAGLTARSFLNLTRVDPGFQTESLLAVRVSAPPGAAETIEGRASFTRSVLQRVRALPGVEAAGATMILPLEDGDWGYNYSVEEHPLDDPNSAELTPGRILAPGYFESMGIPVLAGRDFSDADRVDAPMVAIVSSAFQERYWPGAGAAGALGKRIKRGTFSMENPWLEIVGVVGDIRSGSLADAVRPAVFYPQAQTAGAYLSVMVYTLKVGVDASSLMPSVRSAVAEVSPAATVFRPSTGADVERIALGASRFNSLIIGIFALVGLLLAAAGTYGCTAYAVGRRTREFGVRVALGARPEQVRGLVVRGGLITAIAGIALGTGGALLLTRLLGDLLYGVEAGDASTYVLVSAVLGGTVLLASYLPSRRAMRIDPTVALKEE